MKKIFPFIFSGIFISMFMVSCDHNTDIYDGPNLIDRFGEFIVNDSLTVSTESVDFSAGENRLGNYY